MNLSQEKYDRLVNLRRLGYTPKEALRILNKKPVTKTVRINLLGETPKEEKSRLLKSKISLILQGKNAKIVNKELQRGGKGYLMGTTKKQREQRRKLLSKTY
jgi:hypothetical protein